MGECRKAARDVVVSCSSGSLVMSRSKRLLVAALDDDNKIQWSMILSVSEITISNEPHTLSYMEEELLDRLRVNSSRVTISASGYAVDEI